MNLVIVESPTKARTIKRFLPDGFDVATSKGHLRDLPESASAVPKQYKSLPWASLGVDVEHDFTPLYVVPRGKAKVVKELKEKLKKAETLYLATDEDREGESISWHIIELLKPTIPVKRMVFHEITKHAIQEALTNTRSLNMQLVKAQEARRILDRLFGYTLSPLLWKKIKYGLSAGRVQSAGLRMIIEREQERIRFVPASYGSITASLSPASGATDAFSATLAEVDGKKIATGKDFNPETGKLKKEELSIITPEKAKSLIAELRGVPFSVSACEEKESFSSPPIPFITSTLQQEANKKLNLSAKETMRIAQTLYEEGFITYMRTDSPALSSEAITAARNAVVNSFGDEYLSPTPRQFAASSKTAQEAHEAIRPAGTAFRSPEETGLAGRERELYELIWKRTLASQMKKAHKITMHVTIAAGAHTFKANGTRIAFAGFLKLWNESEQAASPLPPLSPGDSLTLQDLNADTHTTKPPARYTEASLIKRLEQEGIGRPSTYATIISIILDRGYAYKSGNALVPTLVGWAVAQLLEKNFPQLVDYGFTSQMEETLDDIARGEQDSLKYLQTFYAGKSGLKETIEKKEEEISPEDSKTIAFPHLPKTWKIKIGKFGPYLSFVAPNGEKKTLSLPDSVPPADLTEEKIKELIAIQKNESQPIGSDPETGEPIFVLSGRFGAYVQLGKNENEQGNKPKRVSIPRGTNPQSITLSQALFLLSLPKTLGNHPETKQPITLHIGRYGPYVACDNEFRSLKANDNIFTITLERACELLSEEKKTRRGSTEIKKIGTHPKTGKPIMLYEGKYGLYLKHGTVNVALPANLKKDAKKASSLSVADAAAIIQEAKNSKKKKRA